MPSSYKERLDEAKESVQQLSSDLETLRALYHNTSQALNSCFRAASLTRLRVGGDSTASCYTPSYLAPLLNNGVTPMQPYDLAKCVIEELGLYARTAINMASELRQVDSSLMALEGETTRILKTPQLTENKDPSELLAALSTLLPKNLDSHDHLSDLDESDTARTLSPLNLNLTLRPTDLPTTLQAPRTELSRAGTPVPSKMEGPPHSLSPLDPETDDSPLQLEADLTERESEQASGNSNRKSRTIPSVVPKSKLVSHHNDKKDSPRKSKVAKK